MIINSKTTLLLCTLLFAACAGSPEVIEEPAPIEGPIAVKDVHDPCGRPLPGSGEFDLDVRERLGYSRGFEKNWKIPAWVGYRLERSYFQPGAAKFEWGGRFLVDPDLDGEFLVTHNHYASTGLDRGQMAPHAAMQGRTAEVVRESGYMTNVAPQYASLNARLWRNLESQVRKWTRTYGRVYVITGPVFAEGGRNLQPAPVANWMTPQKPGLEEKIAIPTHFFKILYRKTGDGVFALAFVVPNQEKRFEDDWDFRRWQVTIDQVETLTGFDFLSRLDDDIERPVEARREAIWE